MTKTGKSRQVVRAHQGIDRVDLHHAKALDLRLQLLVNDGAARHTPEPLGSQGQTTRFSERKGHGDSAYQAGAANA